MLANFSALLESAVGNNSLSMLRRKIEHAQSDLFH
jgi:hypothetical protein